MAEFVSNILNLAICPFKDNDIFILVAGFLSVSWLFRTVYNLIRDNY